MSRTILITGAAGFVGHHMVEHFLKNTEDAIIGLDCLNYSGTWDRIRDIVIQHPEQGWITGYVHPRFSGLSHDFRLPAEPNLVKELREVTHIMHLGAESHVDASILDPAKFVTSNVLGTVNMLNLARQLPNLELFTYFSCYDEKTRALTKDGLKTFKELTDKDIVFSVNQETGELEETEINKVIVQDYEGTMIKFGGKRQNLLVTPNHRMYYETSSGMKKWENAEHMFKKPNLKTQKGFWKGNDKIDFKTPVLLDTPEKQKAFMYVCGCFVGDGFTAYQEKSYPSTYVKKRCATTGRFFYEHGDEKTVTMKSYRIWLDIPESDPARKILVESLNILGISFTEQKNKSGEHVYFTSKEWMVFFDEFFGKGAKNKLVDTRIKSLSQDLLKEFFKGAIDSDGHLNKDGINSYSTVSKNLAESMAEIGFKIGYFPRIGKNKSKGNYLKKENRWVKSGESYVVWFAKSCPRFIPKNNKEENYKGNIWCLNLSKNKNFIVERENVFSISGNTDEVFGPAPMIDPKNPPHPYDRIARKGFAESDKHDPKNPYAASKSAAEQFVTSFANTYGLPCIITRQMNIFGERQHSEKYIPKCIKAARDGEKILVHGTPDKKRAGMRHYIHARNVADAHLWLLKEKPWLSRKSWPKDPESYHIVGEIEMDNLKLAETINDFVKAINPHAKGLSTEIVDFHSSRAGHDLRYALDGTKMKGLGWEPPKTFHTSLKKVIEWSLDNYKWLE